MTEVTRTGDFDVAAERLWELVADFGGIDKYMDGIDECTLEGDGVGALRSIPGQGGVVVERLDVFEPDARTLTYSIIEGNLPFEDYSATMTVTDSGPDASTLTWTGTFEPRGVALDKAERLAGAIYDAGIAGYRRTLG